MTANPMSSIPPIGPTSGVGAAPMSSRFKPIDPMRVLRKHIVLFIVMGVCGVLVGGGTWFLLLTYSPKWMSQAQLRHVGGTNDPWSATTSDTGFAARMDMIEAQIQAEILHISSEDILREAINQPIVQNTQWFQKFNDLQSAREALANDHLSVGMVRNAPVMRVSVTTTNKDDCKRIVDAIIRVYRNKLEVDATLENAGLRTVFQRERERAEAEIQQLQTQIRDFRVRENLSALEANHSEANIEYQRLAQQRTDLELGLAQAQESYRAIAQSVEGGAPPSPSDVAEVQMMPGIEARAERLRTLREEREVMVNKYGPSHPTVQDIDLRIAATESEKKREEERMLRELQDVKVSSAKLQVEGLQASIGKVEQNLQAAATRLTDLNNTLAEYQQLLDLLENAKSTRDRAAESLGNIQISSTRPDAVPFNVQAGATTPELVFPKIQVVVPGITFLFLGATAGLVFLRELLDQRVRSPLDVKMIADAELLGTVPDTDEDPTQGVSLDRAVLENPTGLMAESFRQVRTAILSKMDRRGYKTLVLVGAQPESGTTRMIHNLAASLSLNGRKVLIVDANFRRPMQHTLAGLANEQGLVEVLNDQAQVDQVVGQMQDTNIFVLPTGHSRNAPPELLEGSNFRSLLSQLETKFDLVLIDAAPALLTSDARLLAKHVDAMVIVIHARADKRGMIERMWRNLDGQRADLLGVILNRVQSSAGGYFRRSYQQFYRYSQTNGRGAATSDTPRTSDRSTAMSRDDDSVSV